VVGEQDSKHHSVRVIADHIRSCSFLIADGVMPSNEGRGYVLRRIIRRAVRHGYQLGGKTPFFHELVSALADEMGQAYPELHEKNAMIEAALKKEELRFAETLDQGLKIFEQKTKELSGNTVPGDLVFLLYDTYGFPADLTADVAREKGMVIDQGGFEELMEQQRARARAGSQFAVQEELSIDVAQSTEFLGYTDLSASGNVLALNVDGQAVDFVSAGQQAMVVLDSTTFYAEGGGQCGDEGQITTQHARLTVSDCKKLANGAFLHITKVEEGSLKLGDRVVTEVDSEARYAAAANHSATHLLHAALKKILGDHVQQKGSLVMPNRLRFDFSHDAPVSHEQILQIETLVNNQIFEQRDVRAKVMPIDDAKAAGAEALFGEKYGAEVRTISMGEFSFELCGGTHVANTAEIGLFKISAESGVAAGVRRVEAVTRRAAYAWVNEQQSLMRNATSLLKTDAGSLSKRIEQFQNQIKTLELDKKKLQQLIASGTGGQDIASQAKEVAGVMLLTTVLDGADKEMLRTTIDTYKDKHDNGIIVLGAEVDGKVKLVAGVSKGIAKQFPAGKLIQHITALAGGRGGGRPDMAEGGISDVSALQMCLDGVESWLLDSH